MKKLTRYEVVSKSMRDVACFIGRTMAKFEESILRLHRAIHAFERVANKTKSEVKGVGKKRIKK